jgi:hypothetical protein
MEVSTEVRDWLVAEAAATRDVELPSGVFEEFGGYRRWFKRLPPHGKKFALAWVAAIMSAQRAEMNADLLGRLRSMMKADVHESLTLLMEGASDAVVDAWTQWYPQHVAAIVRDLREAEPELFQKAEPYARMMERRAKDAHAERMRLERSASLGRKLREMLASSPDGMIRWKPDEIARKLAPSANTNKLPRIKPLAQALVEAGFAEFKRHPSGRPWALAVV